ncbi:MAG: hypothetical protein Q4Q17_05245 [Tissierellia bacterium]|nr:hypothetical protein [Tissierellia bacterium]
MKNKRLYSGEFLFFPLWLLMIFPNKWIITIPFCVLMDVIALYLALRFVGAEQMGSRMRRFIPGVLLSGGICHLLGVGLLSLLMWIGTSFHFKSKLGTSIINGVLNSYDKVYDILWPILLVIAIGALIYTMNKKIIFSRSKFTKEEIHKIALVIALVTAPYLFLFPVQWTGFFI